MSIKGFYDNFDVNEVMSGVLARMINSGAVKGWPAVIFLIDSWRKIGRGKVNGFFFFTRGERVDVWRLIAKNWLSP